jgi:microcystin-dependent protein
MSRNGSGTYILPTGNPVVTGTTISSNWANTTLSDMATALTGSVAADGQTPITGNLQMGGNKITGLADGSALTDAATYGQVVGLNSVITGTIQMWPTVSAPSGYLLCAGSAVSRTTYAALFAVIGTTFGAGDGSTTFNLPNYADRFPIGTGTIAALAGTGGTKDAVVVAHTHTITDPGHSHGNGFNVYAHGYPYQDQDGGYASTTSSATTGISVNSAGVSGTNANLPPYLGINFIIKV